MTLFALFCALAAFALLGLATDAHHLCWFGRRPARGLAQRMRTAAWTALAIGAAASIADRGWAMGPVVALGLVMLAAGVVFLFLNFASPAPRAALSATPERITR